MTATIDPKEVPVTHSIRKDVDREFLTVACPEGWDDVKKICKKVLTFEERKFTFSGWNSDRNEAFFYRMLSEGNVRKVATIS
jgi:diphthamide synthase subunit DPH2